ncbi:DNA cytosine methyltransferase [Saccharospirillum sp. HFRX-1]|uniref:DNA cytosine methyltransferase n=1 Tax=unclassified Saccharospirillum TaxID=2633430 RepID=UPI003715ED8E
MKIPIISFFTGGGFLDIGFKQAGFSICWTNENNPSFISGYEYGMSTWLSSLDVRGENAAITNTDSICDLTAKNVLKEAFSGPRPAIFGVIGGPPCPDFSNGGNHAGGEGPRGALTSVFTDMICDIKPGFFIIENVSGLYRFKKHRFFLEEKISQLRKSGYIVDYKVLNALELGVPQDRERLFVVGFKKTLVKHVEKDLSERKEGWFPWPVVDAYTGAKMLSWPTIIPFGDEPKKPSDVPLELTVFPALLGRDDPEKLPNGSEFFNPYSHRFNTVSEGDVRRKSFKRLHRYRFSPTAWYGNQEVHLHPSKARRLSVRETLRIQSVPDKYELPTDMSLSSKFKMICNGVPCTMAFHLAMSVKSFLSRANV